MATVTLVPSKSCTVSGKGVVSSTSGATVTVVVVVDGAPVVLIASVVFTVKGYP